MNVEVKKNLVIFHEPRDWSEISKKIVQDYGPSVMISWRCRRELGFTVRHHKGLVAWTKEALEDFEGFGSRPPSTHYYEDQVHLDFYNDAQQSFFVLKYLNF